MPEAKKNEMDRDTAVKTLKYIVDTVKGQVINAATGDPNRLRSRWDLLIKESMRQIALLPLTEEEKETASQEINAVTKGKEDRGEFS